LQAVRRRRGKSGKDDLFSSKQKSLVDQCFLAISKQQECLGRWMCLPRLVFLNKIKGLLAYMGMYSFSSAAVTKYHKLGDLNDQYVLSHSSGGQKSEIKMLAW